MSTKVKFKNRLRMPSKKYTFANLMYNANFTHSSKPEPSEHGLHTVNVRDMLTWGVRNPESMFIDINRPTVKKQGFNVCDTTVQRIVKKFDHNSLGTMLASAKPDGFSILDGNSRLWAMGHLASTNALKEEDFRAEMTLRLVSEEDAMEAFSNVNSGGKHTAVNTLLNPEFYMGHILHDLQAQSGVELNGKQLTAVAYIASGKTYSLDFSTNNFLQAVKNSKGVLGDANLSICDYPDEYKISDEYFHQLVSALRFLSQVQTEIQNVMEQVEKTDPDYKKLKLILCSQYSCGMIICDHLNAKPRLASPADVVENMVLHLEDISQILASNRLNIFTVPDNIKRDLYEKILSRLSE